MARNCYQVICFLQKANKIKPRKYRSSSARMTGWVSLANLSFKLSSSSMPSSLSLSPSPEQGIQCLTFISLDQAWANLPPLTLFNKSEVVWNLQNRCIE